jgi:cytochrome P450
MISNIYSKSTLQSSAPLASQARTILFSRLLPIVTASTDPSLLPHGIDVHDLWNAATMDFITAYIFGLPHSTNFLQNVGYRQHLLDLYQSRKKYTFFPQELPRLTKIAHAIGIRLVPKWVDYANQEIEAFCASMCKAATAAIMANKSLSTNPADEAVVMQALLAGHEKERQQKGSNSVLNDTVLREPELSVYSEMLDQLAAGHETAGITMTFLTWHLSQDIELQNALRAELLTLDHPLIYPPLLGSTSAEKSFKDGERDQLNDVQMPNSKQLDSLPTLHAIIMETLRIKAAIPGGQPRMTPYPSCTLGKYEIPGGVRVGATAYSLHRNVNVYPRPSAWDYTRWLDSPDQKNSEARREQDRWFWAFSSGGRMCIGSNFAMHGKLTYVVKSSHLTHISRDEVDHCGYIY